MDVTIEISERDHASVRHVLNLTLFMKPRSKDKLPGGYVKLHYAGLTEKEVELIQKIANNNWKITIILNP